MSTRRPKVLGQCQAIDENGRCTEPATHVRYQNFVVCDAHNGHKAAILRTRKLEDGTWTKE